MQTCVHTCLAYILNRSLAQVIKDLGHDGSIILPDGQPRMTTGEEAVDYLNLNGVPACFIETQVQLTANPDVYLYTQPYELFITPEDRMFFYLTNFDGIFLNNDHATFRFKSDPYTDYPRAYVALLGGINGNERDTQNGYGDSQTEFSEG